MTAAEHVKPTYARNMRLIGHSDQAGRSDGQQIMVRNGYAYIGHVCSKGFSVIDVRDPTKPEAVAYVQNPPTHGACICRSTTICCCSSMAATCSLNPRWRTSATTISRSRARTARMCPIARVTGRREWRCSTFPSPQRRAKSASCR